MAIGQETLSYRDAKGQTARVLYYVTFTADADRDTQASNIATKMNALSNANNYARTGGAPKLPTFAYGASATYQEAQDKAVLTFAAADGTLHRYQVPAPLSAIFKADQQTVDPAQAAVAAFVTAFTGASLSATTTSKSGSQITTFIGGVRVKRKLPRRISIYTKSSDLGSPAQ